MSDSQTDVKMENASSEDVKAQQSSQDVQNETVPYSRFKEVNSNYKSLKDDHDKLNTRLNDIEESKMIAEGKKDDVIASLKGNNAELTKKVGTLENYVNDERSRLLESIPEEKRELYAGVDLLVLRDIASDKNEQLTKKIGVENKRGGTTMTSPKDFHEMSVEEKSDPAVWSAYLERFKRK